MDACITVDGDAGDAGAALLEWLRREPELRGLVREVRRPSRPETMGVPIELMVSVLGSPVFIALARSVRTWLEHRRSDVKVEVETARGRASLSVTDAKDPDALLHKLAQIMADAPSSGPGPEPEPDPKLGAN